MTTVLQPVGRPQQLDESVRALHEVIPLAGYGVPAAALRVPGVSGWARAEGVSVFADGVDDLDLLSCSSVRPVQVVLRHPATVDVVRRAIGMGISRFVVSDAQHIDVLARCAHRTVYVYLDSDTRLVDSPRRIEVAGLHCAVDDSDGHIAWGSAAERLLCRLATLRSCGTRPHRICLVGTRPASDRPRRTTPH